MSFRQHLSRVATRAAAGLLAAVALVSCGGGTYQVNEFVPQRILSFGDENSLLVPPQGQKYTINGISTSTDLTDCSLLPLWNQVLATSYGLTYAECNPEAVASPSAFNFSAANATVDDVNTQVQSFLAGDSFNGNDLVTIWVGLHDVLDIYSGGSTGGDTSDLIVQARARGNQLAGIVNSIIGAGAKVLVLTIPDMGQSPFAYNEQNAHGDFNRVQLLSDLSNNFNRAMRSAVVNDGSKVGLVLPDDYVNSATRAPSSYGYAGDAAITPGCLDSVPLPLCTEETLVVDTVTNSSATAIFLWADPTHLAPTAHNSIGSQAVSRAHSNPF